MAVKVQAAFSAGEIDPALYERTTLAKYSTGLRTGRNIIVEKTGRPISRPGRKFFIKTKIDGRASILYCPPQSGYLIEWGHLYVRVYAIDTRTGLNYGQLVDEYVHTITEAELPVVKFRTSGDDVYIFVGGKTTMKLSPSPGGGFYPTTGAFGVFYIPAAPTFVSGSTSGTGYDVDYAFTTVINGQESAFYLLSSSNKLPINNGELVTTIMDLGASTDIITEMKTYRRPKAGGAFGYIGSSSSFAVVSGRLRGTFIDVGGAADYTHSPPATTVSMTVRGFAGPQALLSQCGTIYQQRLLLANSFFADQIQASRIGFPSNFSQDFPIGDDSALSFKCGTAGKPYIFDMIEDDGLIVFTSFGVFLHSGALAPDNLALTRKGPWTISQTLPPMVIPGGTIFNDSGTNSVRILQYSTEASGYLGDELSIFSSHLFRSKSIKSWAFQRGALPIIYLTMSDGTFLTFTFVHDQEMRAWTRHDSERNVEFTCETGLDDITAFIVEEAGVRNIELSVPRYASPDLIAADPQYQIGEIAAAMDSMITIKNCLNDSLTNGDEVVVEALYMDESGFNLDWSNILKITCGTSAIFGSPAYVGQTIRFFDSDNSSVDLLVLTRDSLGNTITVQPSVEFPSEFANLNPNLYQTFNYLTGLDSLEGKYVSAMVDGYVFASPNNDDQNFEPIQVVGGAITLANEMRGAIIHIGLPITFDVETLDIDTVEQRPVQIESKILNKLYVKTYNTRGLYAGANFPADDKVDGMIDLDSIQVDYSQDNEVIGNAPQAPTSKRIEVSIPGDWATNGRVCLRQVDPVHFEILSITPDLNDLRRGG